MRGSPDPAPSPPDAGPPLLVVDALTVRFDGVTALDGLSFTVPADVTLGLLGPNGAGKSTLFDCISRLCPVAGGDLRWHGRSLLELSPEAVAGLGVGRTFQHLALFPTMSVLDNVRVGRHRLAGGSLAGDMLRLPGARRRERDDRAQAMHLLARLGLSAVADRPAALLSVGQQKRVALARALAARPRLLLLDEPAAGMSEPEIEAFARLLRELRAAQRLTVVLIEHNMPLLMTLSDRVIALAAGRLVAEGEPERVRRDPALIDAYFGVPGTRDG